jgi:hypothetical protein
MLEVVGEKLQDVDPSIDPCLEAELDLIGSDCGGDFEISVFVLIEGPPESDKNNHAQKKDNRRNPEETSAFG